MSGYLPEAIFFDWDGTAVQSRKAPADEAAAAMKPLLAAGIRLVIVSGTTIDQIAGGCIGRYFTEKELDYLYLGLGRGAYNYRFCNGSPVIFSHCIPDKEELLKIHEVSFDIHRKLLKDYDFRTDIVFSRPNYCKIDLMVDSQRGDQLFMQGSELERLKDSLAEHKIEDGLHGLLQIAEDAAAVRGIKMTATCDAKYLEAGISSKSDNVSAMLALFDTEADIRPDHCTFWGDEFIGIEPGIFGSDSYMITNQSRTGKFYDVSDLAGERPVQVEVTGGGTVSFISYLKRTGSLISKL